MLYVYMCTYILTYILCIYIYIYTYIIRCMQTYIYIYMIHCSSGKRMEFSKVLENVPFLGEFPIRTLIHRGFSTAMFDYHRVTMNVANM